MLSVHLWAYCNPPIAHDMNDAGKVVVVVVCVTPHDYNRGYISIMLTTGLFLKCYILNFSMDW